MRHLTLVVIFLFGAIAVRAQVSDSARNDSVTEEWKVGSSLSFDAVRFSADLFQPDRSGGLPVGDGDTISISRYSVFIAGTIYGIDAKGWEVGFGLRYLVFGSAHSQFLSFGATAFVNKGFVLPGRFHLTPGFDMSWMSARVESDGNEYRQSTISLGLHLGLGYLLFENVRGENHYLELGGGISYPVLRDILLRDGDVYREVHHDDILSLPLQPTFRIGWTIRPSF